MIRYTVFITNIFVYNICLYVQVKDIIVRIMLIKENELKESIIIIMVNTYEVTSTVLLM